MMSIKVSQVSKASQIPQFSKFSKFSLYNPRKAFSRPAVKSAYSFEDIFRDVEGVHDRLVVVVKKLGDQRNTFEGRRKSSVTELHTSMKDLISAELSSIQKLASDIQETFVVDTQSTTKTTKTTQSTQSTQSTKMTNDDFHHVSPDVFTSDDDIDITIDITKVDGTKWP